jgi:hypothetical protein
VLRKLYGPKRNTVTGDGRKLHNGELHDLYISLVIKSRRMRHMVCVGVKRNADSVFGG